MTDFNFDSIIQKEIESLFPVKLKPGNEGDEHHFHILFDERFPPLAGLEVKITESLFNQFTQDMNVAYDVITNPNGIHPSNSGVQSLVFKVLSSIFQLEDSLISQKIRSDNK